jgi:hypothetical protein
VFLRGTHPSPPRNSCTVPSRHVCLLADERVIKPPEEASRLLTHVSRWRCIGGAIFRSSELSFTGSPRSEYQSSVGCVARLLG